MPVERGAVAPETAGLRGEWRWIVLVAAGAVAPCLAVLLAGRTLSWRDSASLFEPLRPLITDAIRQLRLPLWNPYEAGGVPLFGQMMHGVLHPWSLLSALLALRNTADLMIVLHVITGAVGAGVIARELGATRPGAAMAGLGYGLSGYLLGLTSNLQYLAGGGTAPWTIAALQRVGSARPRSVALAATAVAVLVFAGDPQWVIVAAVLGAVLAVEKSGAKGAWLAAGSVMLGGATAAIQLVPAWAMFAQTSRPAGLTPADMIQWSLNPGRVLEFIVPGLFAGRPGPTPAPVFLWFEDKSQYPLPFLPSVFIGLPVLICAAWGLRATRSARWCGMAAGVLLWIALGHRLYATQVLSSIPIWGSFRYAEKLVGPFTLLSAVIAGIGLPSFASRGLDWMRRAATLGVLSLVASAAVLFIAGRVTPGPERWPAEIWPLLSARLAGGFLLAGGTLGVMALAATRHSPGSPVRERWILVLVFVSGAVTSPAALHAGRRDARDPKPLSDLRRAASVPRVIQPVDQIRLPVSRGFDMFDAAQVVRSAAGRPPYNVPARVDAFVTYTGLLPRRYSDLLNGLEKLGPAQWIAFRRFAVTHVVLTPPLTERDMVQAQASVLGGRRVWVDPLNSIDVFEVPHTPWARFATRVREVSDEEAIARVIEGVARGDETVVLERTAPSSLGKGSILSIERDVDHVRVVAAAPSDGLLILGDSWWPGWVAEIDHRPVPISRADAVFRAVEWPAGRHVLEMTYRPREVYVGATISALAIILLFGLTFVPYAERRGVCH